MTHRWPFPSGCLLAVAVSIIIWLAGDGIAMTITGISRHDLRPDVFGPAPAEGRAA